MANTLSFLVVAGEASGDLHAAAAVRALQHLRPEATCFGMGGDHLRACGVETLYDANDVAVMGLTEVVSHLPVILGALSGLAKAAARRRPAAALLVDLPDFNLRLARRLRKLGIPVVYYVSPMVWAWRVGRTRALARDVAEVLCIYPFEEAFLRERGVHARYVGNPLLEDCLPALALPPPTDPLALRLAILPGSRRAEIARLFEPMLAAVALLAKAQPVEIAISVAPTIPVATLQETLDRLGVTALLVPGNSRAVLRWSQVALVKSGTVTLEACLEERPMVVVYRTSAMTFLAARRLLRVPFVSIVNLLAGRALVPELLQDAATPAAMAAALQDVQARRVDLIAGYREVRGKLGGPGAAERVATALLRQAIKED